MAVVSNLKIDEWLNVERPNLRGTKQEIEIEEINSYQIEYMRVGKIPSSAIYRMVEEFQN